MFMIKCDYLEEIIKNKLITKLILTIILIMIILSIIGCGKELPTLMITKKIGKGDMIYVHIQLTGGDYGIWMREIKCTYTGMYLEPGIKNPGGVDPGMERSILVGKYKVTPDGIGFSCKMRLDMKCELMKNDNSIAAHVIFLEPMEYDKLYTLNPD